MPQVTYALSVDELVGPVWNGTAFAAGWGVTCHKWPTASVWTTGRCVKYCDTGGVVNTLPQHLNARNKTKPPVTCSPAAL